MAKPSKTPSTTKRTNPMTEFYRAYQQLGGSPGRGFVLIHKIRNLLRWPQQQFNTFLLTLLEEDVVEGQQGNPSQMTYAEIKDSIFDPAGRLLTCCTWWGRCPSEPTPTPSSW